MKGPATFSNGSKRGVSVFEGKGLTDREALDREAEVFDELTRGGLSPLEAAVKYETSVPTIYAIERREKSRRESKRPAITTDGAESVNPQQIAGPQAECTKKGEAK